jgi:hypothetical protein
VFEDVDLGCKRTKLKDCSSFFCFFLLRNFIVGYQYQTVLGFRRPREEDHITRTETGVVASQCRRYGEST